MLLSKASRHISVPEILAQDRFRPNLPQQATRLCKSNPLPIYLTQKREISVKLMPCRLRPSSTSTETYIAAYFEWFHPSFPLLHQPTFGNETPEILRNIVTAIGCLYTARTLSDEDASSCVKLSKSLWDTGRRSLARLVRVLCFYIRVFPSPNTTLLTVLFPQVGSDWKELRRTWTMQAWILHIIYGAFMGSASQYKEAKKMLRTGVDVRMALSIRLSFWVTQIISGLRLTTNRLPKILVYSDRL